MERTFEMAPADNITEGALVLFSGGQDSAVCLAWALDRYPRVETLGFAYGQRHAVELIQRRIVLEAIPKAFPAWAPRLGPDHEIELSELGRISETSLTRETEIELSNAGLPSTFVPGRNLLFLVYAAAIAYRRGLNVIVAGMCETDYSGYPDCRNDTIRAQEQAIALGLDKPFTVATPLMYVDKAGTWAMAEALGGQPLVSLIREETHTCYLGDRSVLHAWGRGCGACPACELRAKGWEIWQASKSIAAPAAP
jgi:7-cyano-7-deazaguanine synthase